MLRKLSEQVADCHRRAQNERESAERACSEAEELDCLAAERRWLLLAQSYELVERLTDFRNESKKRAAKSPLEPRPSVALLCPGCGKEMRQLRINLPGTSSLFARTRLTCVACDVTALHTKSDD